MKRLKSEFIIAARTKEKNSENKPKPRSIAGKNNVFESTRLVREQNKPKKKEEYSHADLEKTHIDTRPPCQ